MFPNFHIFLQSYKWGQGTPCSVDTRVTQALFIQFQEEIQELVHRQMKGIDRLFASKVLPFAPICSKCFYEFYVSRSWGWVRPWAGCETPWFWRADLITDMTSVWDFSRIDEACPGWIVGKECCLSVNSNSGFSLRILASSQYHGCAVHCGTTIISSDRTICILCSTGAIRLKRKFEPIQLGSIQLESI